MVRKKKRRACKHKFVSEDMGVTWKCIKCGKVLDFYTYMCYEKSKLLKNDG